MVNLKEHRERNGQSNMQGILINGISIVGCSALGSICKSKISEVYKKLLMQIIGLITLIYGINMSVGNFSKSKHPLWFIISLVIGGVIGQALHLDEMVDKLNKKDTKSNALEGFMMAVMICCLGALPILGAIESAINGDNTLLYTNSAFCGITCFVLASRYGITVGLSSVVLFLIETCIYLIAHFANACMSAGLVTEISIVGGVLVFAAGLNSLNIAKIKVINLFPAFLPLIILFIIENVW